MTKTAIIATEYVKNYVFNHDEVTFKQLVKESPNLPLHIIRPAVDHLNTIGLINKKKHGRTYKFTPIISKEKSSDEKCPPEIKEAIEKIRSISSDLKEKALEYDQMRQRIINLEAEVQLLKTNKDINKDINKEECYKEGYDTAIKKCAYFLNIAISEVIEAID